MKDEIDGFDGLIINTTLMLPGMNLVNMFVLKFMHMQILQQIYFVNKIVHIYASIVT